MNNDGDILDSINRQQTRDAEFEKALVQLGWKKPDFQIRLTLIKGNKESAYEFNEEMSKEDLLFFLDRIKRFVEKIS